MLGRKTLAALFCVLALLPACASGATRRLHPVPPDAPRLAVLSWNVNYGLAGDPGAAAVISSSGADLVLLQETNEAWETSLESSLRSVYPYRRFLHRPGAGGLGILSKFPFEEVGILEPPEGGWFAAWLVRVDSPIGRVQALVVHLRPALGDEGGVVSGYFQTPAVRESEMRAHLDRLDPAIPAIVAGDFNESPEDDARRFARSRGFLSSLEVHDPAPYTWRWRTSGFEFADRFDDVLHDPRLAPASARVLEAGRSDHLPVLVELAAAEPGT